MSPGHVSHGLEARVEEAWANRPEVAGATEPEVGALRQLAKELLGALERGEVRAASRHDGAWRVHAWVKRGILLAFRTGRIVQMQRAGALTFTDKDLLAPREASTLPEGVRLVPGGSSVRAGACISRGVTLMPPCYVNVGAFVGESSMVDSHALVGSCAQIGARVHLSAAAQIGGVLEPVGDLPVIIEDDVFVGGNVGVFEGVLVRERSVLAAGVVLTRSSAVADLVTGTIHRANEQGVLEIPAGSVVVPGSRSLPGEFAREHGLAISTPIILKHRSESTDARVALESALRS